MRQDYTFDVGGVVLIRYMARLRRFKADNSPNTVVSGYMCSVWCGLACYVGPIKVLVGGKMHYQSCV